MRHFDPIPDTAEFQRCDHCNQLQNNWLWRLVEAYPDRTYEKLCMHCIRHQEATFLFDNVIRQAEGIVKFHQAVISGRCVRATGGEQ